MSDTVPRAAVEAFYAAFVSREPERIAALVDEDVCGGIDLADGGDAAALHEHVADELRLRRGVESSFSRRGCPA